MAPLSRASPCSWLAHMPFLWAWQVCDLAFRIIAEVTALQNTALRQYIMARNEHVTARLAIAHFPPKTIALLCAISLTSAFFLAPAMAAAEDIDTNPTPDEFQQKIEQTAADLEEANAKVAEANEAIRNHRAEITKLEEKLVDPCRIEEGYNAVLSGRYEAGIDILSIYEDDERFNVWWPLWYYLGVAYMETGDAEEAKKKLLNVLKYSPSNTDAMSLLVEIYEAEGNAEKAKKYADKIGIVNANAELDREEKRKEQGSTVS